MTSHLTPEQFVDALDRPLPADREAHLAVCPSCADELAEMRRVMVDVGVAGDVPEPSPLYWEHLSARVREAVDAVPEPQPWWRARWRPVLAFAGVLGVVVIAAVLRPGPVAPTAAPANVDATATISASAESDAMWDMISTLASDVPVDQAIEAGLAPSSGTADAAIASLTDAQRRELMRLLKREMGAE